MSVVPPHPVENPLIVVGVSASTGSRAALRWAVAASGGAGARVRAVMAWRMPRPPSAPAGRPPASLTLASSDDPGAEAQATLERLVFDALGQSHSVQCLAIRGTAAGVLLEQAKVADLLVVDSPRTTKLSNVSATFVAPQLIFEASCPVVVMPPPGGGPLERLREVGGKAARRAAQAAATAGRPGLPPRLPAGEEW